MKAFVSSSYLNYAIDLCFQYSFLCAKRAVGFVGFFLLKIKERNAKGEVGVRLHIKTDAEYLTTRG